MATHTAPLYVIIAMMTASGFCEIRTNMWYRANRNGDTTSILLWNLKVRSATDCAAACGEKEDCIGFSFTSSSSMCQGHSVKLPASGQESEDTVRYTLLQPDTPENTGQHLTSQPMDVPSTAVPNQDTTLQTTTLALTQPPSQTTQQTQTPLLSTTSSVNEYTSTASSVSGCLFSSLWLDDSCNTNSECTKTNAVCFFGQCKCDPGYYYSKCGDSCQQGCPAEDLEDGFVRYRGHYIMRRNIDYGTKSLTQCQDWCLATAACRTYEHRASDNKCYIAEVTKLDEPDDWVPKDFDYYQRMCL